MIGVRYRHLCHLYMKLVARAAESEKTYKMVEDGMQKMLETVNEGLKNKQVEIVSIDIVGNGRGGSSSTIASSNIGSVNEAARLTKEQLKQTKQFKKSHVPPRNILRFFREQNVGCAVSAQKIYNVVAKIKKNKMHRRNTVDEVLCLSAQWGYTIFYRNNEDSNVLSDNVVAYTISIAMIRTLLYVLIMNISYKTNKLRHIDKYLNKSSIDMFYRLCQLAANQFLMMCRRHINQNVLAKLTEMVKDKKVTTRFVSGTWHKLINEIDEAEYRRKLDGLKTKWQQRPDFIHYLFNTWLNPLANKFWTVWTSKVLHFGVETTNRAKSEHSVLKLWLSTYHGDLDTVFLNIDSLIEGQIA
ncbi:hypothetical protein M9H77_26268 [Catharanthus roseus]|uniref:Uncharacterized protein n=1 Tax=Catharanthus roseus TaxID=4058 RepID=A0ACC0A9A6_CATRO|nr:hypothetical protein M9H77_26268 [Catharanthus roseus]